MQTASGQIGVTFGADVASDSLIVVAVAASDLSKARISTSRNRGGLQDQITIIGPAGSPGNQCLIAFFPSSEAGPCEIGVANTLGSAIVAFEFAPRYFASDSNGVDLWSGFSFIESSFNEGTGVSADPGAITLTGQAYGLIAVSAVGLSAPSTVTPAAGWTAGPGQAQAATSIGIATAYTLSLPSGPVDGSFGLSASQSWCAVAVALNDAYAILGVI